MTIHFPNRRGLEVLDVASTDPKLSYAELGMLAYLAKMADSDGLAYPSIDSLSGVHVQGREAVARILRGLEGHGYLERDRTRQRGRVTGTVWKIQVPE